MFFRSCLFIVSIRISIAVDILLKSKIPELLWDSSLVCKSSITLYKNIDASNCSLLTKEEKNTFLHSIATEFICSYSAKVKVLLAKAEKGDRQCIG